MELGYYKAFTPKYIEKKVEIWSDVTIAGQTNEQTTEQGKIELLSPWTMDGWDEQKCILKIVHIFKYNIESYCEKIF